MGTANHRALQKMRILILQSMLDVILKSSRRKPAIQYITKIILVFCLKYNLLYGTYYKLHSIELRPKSFCVIVNIMCLIC